MNPGLSVPAVVPTVSERKRFPRYRYSVPIIIRPANATESPAMSVEISEYGLSAVTGISLNVGDLVELEPIGGRSVTAVIRRRFGRFCGFEFLNLSTEQAEKIREMCRRLPQYRSKTLDLWQH
jgi:hypothetical protein